MMDLDEAIQHCKEQVQEQAKKGCYSCAEEHQQLAEWLKELKAYREQSGDTISRKSIKQKLQEHHDFFVNAYGGFRNLPQNDKSRVDEITNCIAMVVNEPSVTP